MAGKITEIKHSGSVYQIQTQDKGLSAQYVESIIYKSGKVLSSKKTSYASSLSSPTYNEKINQIIEEQHKSCLKAVIEGKFNKL